MALTESTFDQRPGAELDFVRTGPGTPAGRLLRRFWQPVLRASDVSAGQSLPLRIMSEDFTLYRGRSGTPFALDARCAHRRSQLSVGWVEEDCVRCLYHGWRYDGGGQCVEQPAEQASFAAKVRIRSYPVREYLGLLFVYFGEGEPPPLPRYPEFEQPGVLDVETFVRPCNFFNDLDNACDPLHVAFVHQGSRIDVNRFIDMSDVAAEETDFGVTIKVKRTTDRGGVRINLFGMPNIALLKLPPTSEHERQWRDFISWRVPVDDVHYASFNVNLVHLSGAAADAWRARQASAAANAVPSVSLLDDVLSGKTTIDEVRERVADVVRLQDDVVLVAQGAVPDREHEHLGRSDRGVIILRQIWQRELRALSRNEPLKQWVRRPDIVATSGFSPT